MTSRLNLNRRITRVPRCVSFGIVCAVATGVTLNVQAAPNSEGQLLQKVPVEDLRPPRYTLALNLHQSWQLDDNYKVFSEGRHVGSAGLSLALRLLHLTPLLSLHALADWQIENSDGRWPLGQTKIEGDSLAAGALVRYAARWWMVPFLRVVGGGYGARAHLQTPQVDLTDRQWSLFSTAALGVSFHTWPLRFSRHGRQVSLSFDVEGGFTLSQTMDFKLRPDGDPGDDAIALDPVAIGQVGRTRPHLRFAVAAHF